MILRTLKGCGGLFLALLFAMTVNGEVVAGVPPCEGSAAMKSPASNAAVVAKLIGLVNNRHLKTMTGIERTVNDGVVIRQSYIKDGKIVIPPEGLYTTSRSANWYPFDAEPISVAGKTYYVIVDRYVRDVIRDVVMKKGDLIPSNEDKSRGWELSSVDGWTTYGLPDGKEAVFKIVKTTGNYYGTSFPVKVGTSISNAAADGSLVAGSTNPAGHTVPDESNNLSRFVYGHNVFSVGRSHVIVDKIDANNNVYVRELATDSCTDLFLSPTKPLQGNYSSGASFTVGDAKVEVKSVGANGAEVAITDGDGRTTTKTLTYPEDTRWFMLSMVDREKCYMLSDNGKLLVHLNIRPGNPFVNDQVNLVAYTDVIHVQNGSDWPSDPRFLVRPET